MTLRRRVVNASSIVGVAVFVLGCSSGDDATTWVSQASGVLNGGVLNGGVLNGGVLNGGVLNGGAFNPSFTVQSCGTTNSIGPDGLCTDGTEKALQRVIAAGVRIPSYVGCWYSDTRWGANDSLTQAGAIPPTTVSHSLRDRWCPLGTTCVSIDQIHNGDRPWGAGNNARPFSSEWQKPGYAVALAALRTLHLDDQAPVWPDMDGLCVAPAIEPEQLNQVVTERCPDQVMTPLEQLDYSEDPATPVGQGERVPRFTAQTLTRADGSTFDGCVLKGTSNGGGADGVAGNLGVNWLALEVMLDGTRFDFVYHLADWIGSFHAESVLPEITNRGDVVGEWGQYALNKGFVQPDNEVLGNPADALHLYRQGALLTPDQMTSMSSLLGISNAGQINHRASPCPPGTFDYRDAPAVPTAVQVELDTPIPSPAQLVPAKQAVWFAGQVSGPTRCVVNDKGVWWDSLATNYREGQPAEQAILHPRGHLFVQSLQRDDEGKISAKSKYTTIGSAGTNPRGIPHTELSRPLFEQLMANVFSQAISLSGQVNQLQTVWSVSMPASSGYLGWNGATGADLDPQIHVATSSALEDNLAVETQLNPAKTMQSDDYVADLTDEIPTSMQDLQPGDVYDVLHGLRGTMLDAHWRRLAFGSSLYASSPNTWALRIDSGKPIIANMLDGLVDASPFTQFNEELIRTTSRLTYDQLASGAQIGVSTCGQSHCDSHAAGVGQLLLPPSEPQLFDVTSAAVHSSFALPWTWDDHNATAPHAPAPHAYSGYVFVRTPGQAIQASIQLAGQFILLCERFQQLGADVTLDANQRAAFATMGAWCSDTSTVPSAGARYVINGTAQILAAYDAMSASEKPYFWERIGAGLGRIGATCGVAGTQPLTTPLSSSDALALADRCANGIIDEAIINAIEDVYNRDPKALDPPPPPNDLGTDLGPPAAPDLATHFDMAWAPAPHDLALPAPMDFGYTAPHDLATPAPWDFGYTAPHDLATAPAPIDFGSTPVDFGSEMGMHLDLGH